jgi:hypothetical protein
MLPQFGHSSTQSDAETLTTYARDCRRPASEVRPVENWMDMMFMTDETNIFFFWFQHRDRLIFKCCVVDVRISFKRPSKNANGRILSAQQRSVVYREQPSESLVGGQSFSRYKYFLSSLLSAPGSRRLAISNMSRLPFKKPAI